MSFVMFTRAGRLRRLLLAFALLLVFPALRRADARAQRSVAPAGFQVIVDAANPIATIDRDALSKMFLKRVTAWPDGKAVVPLDLNPKDATREAFSRAVHRKSVSAIRAFWQQQIFSGRDVPPPEKTSDADVIAAVKATHGAVAYISVGAVLPPGVKLLPVR